MYQVTKLISSQTGFLNIRPPQSPHLNPTEPLWMWWTGRLLSWTCSRHASCISHQYGPKSRRNVSNTLFKVSREELELFWRSNTYTSEVYLLYQSGQWVLKTFTLCFDPEVEENDALSRSALSCRSSRHLRVLAAETLLARWRNAVHAPKAPGD